MPAGPSAWIEPAGEEKFDHTAGTGCRQIPIRGKPQIVNRHIVGMPLDADRVGKPGQRLGDAPDQLLRGLGELVTADRERARLGNR